MGEEEEEEGEEEEETIPVHQLQGPQDPQVQILDLPSPRSPPGPRSHDLQVVGAVQVWAPAAMP